jgi:photosystem I subunit 3
MKFKTSTFISKLICFAVFSFGTFNLSVQPAHADFKNLVPCKDSPAFKKRETAAVKKLENRLKLYTPGTKEAAFLNKEIERVHSRYSRYGQSGLLCGKEGLPRIIASGQWDRANEFVIPGVMFLYITGWIGWVGRKYLRYASTQGNKSFENEIIINVPVAIKIMNSGFLWPVDAWKEFTSGDLLADDDDVTVSPR